MDTKNDSIQNGAASLHPVGYVSPVEKSENATGEETGAGGVERAESEPSSTRGGCTSGAGTIAAASYSPAPDTIREGQRVLHTDKFGTSEGEAHSDAMPGANRIKVSFDIGFRSGQCRWVPLTEVSLISSPLATQMLETRERELADLRAVVKSLEERCNRIAAERDQAKASKAWKFVTVMCDEGAKATAMSNYELCKAIAEEITDKIPMNSREFSLIDELVNRMDGKLKDYFVPVEWYEKEKALATEKSIALENELDDCKPYSGARQMREALAGRAAAEGCETASPVGKKHNVPDEQRP